MAEVTSHASPSNIRIAFVDQSGDAIGGAERSLELLLLHLDRRYHVTVILFGDGRFAQSMRAAKFNVEIVRLPRVLGGVRRERITLASLFPGVLGIVALVRTLRRLDPDLVYTNTVKAHVLGGLAARMTGRKHMPHFRDILDGRARRIVRFVAQTCSVRRIAISEAVNRAYELGETYVVHNPVDMDSYRRLPTKTEARTILGLPSEPTLVGMVGRINRWKGQDRFLRAAAIVAARCDAHFAIVGEPVFRDADFADELRQLAVDLGIADRVHFVPWLNDPRLAYRALDVNCNASLREPFGRTTIEAAAAGVPTVCFDDGGSPEGVPQSQWSTNVVPFGDLEAYASAIFLYANDADRRESAGKAARDFAYAFDVGIHADRIGSLIAGVVGAV
jgi:glycosyltransferase involved in cell wall biosynthesis